MLCGKAQYMKRGEAVAAGLKQRYGSAAARRKDQIVNKKMSEKAATASPRFMSWACRTAHRQSGPNLNFQANGRKRRGHKITD